MSAEVTASPPGVDRQRVVRRATLLNRLTIGWNAVEGIVAIAAGVAASSIGLVAFGLDSGIEVSAALILAWRLHQERRDGCKLEADDRAQKLVAWSFVALASYVSISATLDMGIQTSGGISVGLAPRNAFGATPTIVNGVPLSTRASPTACGSPA